ncbi:hypothetical protein ColLi_03194 [Colletotrichum liriopes]|uniref:CENP-V/GFA domain-containing protein n=1 Tax=Colletotrichum liriopes TaxID=708192 RepID=A0AA37GG69_9PEZI|nr:hypothetical protein ColLi_03194 [Colletotrichum liriopes]
MPTTLNGRCVCSKLQYSAKIDSPDDARTSLCHCSSCKRAFGANYGLTTKVPLEGFSYTKGTPKRFRQENGVIREFCDNCGAFLCEYGEQAADTFRYIMWGRLFQKQQIKE